jgi:hypothetical protein
MKALHRPDLFAWSAFDEARNIDFNTTLWCREDGNVLVDPLPASEHDLAHLRQLGGVAWIVVTNSDHVRAASELATLFDAKIAGPAGEETGFPIACDRWLTDGDEVVPGLIALEMRGSKTPGELALLLGEHTLITGDLVRAHDGGSLTLIPDAKLGNAKEARASVARLLDYRGVDAVLVGDGYPIFRDGHARLAELVEDRRG